MPEEKLSVAQVQAAITAANANWTAGYTSVSGLSSEEKRMRLGVLPPPGGFERVMAQAAAAKPPTAAADIGLPAMYDLRNVNGKNFITDIKDQQNCGSCVAFGVCATLEGQFRVQRNDPTLVVNLSEAHLFFCLGKSQGVTCGTGWMPDNALACSANPGVADEACFPYNLTKTDCSNLCTDWQAHLTRIEGYHGVATAEIKTALTTTGPVTACFVVYDDFFHYAGGVYKHVSGGEAGGHCISIIGYDDTQGCWMVKNSWGTGWGENGFFRIAYGECGIDTWAVYAADRIEETMWLSNRRVLGLWACDQDRNAYAYLDGNIGWRRVAYDDDVVFTDMLMQLAAARLANRPINVYEDHGVLKQAYVF
jgi:C1A family cysteine protease